jgi:glycosyltransferase involved in cell wall biosynthesis
MRPFFSIITVCLNNQAVLPQAIRSLEKQIYRHFEWVVIDGGSVDHTMALVQQAKVPKGRCVTEPDDGIYAAMNKGIHLAQGEVLFFLNADDALHDAEVLSDIAPCFESDPTLGFVYGDIVMQGAHRKVGMTFSHINRWTLPFEFLCHQSVFARHSVFNQVGVFRPQWPTSADYDWLLRAFRARINGCHLDRIVADFREGGAHTRDPQGREQEREVLRMQYMHPWTLAVGSLVSRFAHKTSRLLRNGAAIGEQRL